MHAGSSVFCQKYFGSGLFKKHLQFILKLSTINAFSTQANSSAKVVFDRASKLKQKQRANLNEECQVYDYLKMDIANEIIDRISDVKRDFHLALDLGCGSGFISHQLYKDDTVSMMLQGDSCFEAVNRAYSSEIPTCSFVFDEETKLPFKDDSFDIVCSNLNLHWVNDIPGCFHEVLRILRQDGCFLGSVFGGDTLFQLRCSLQLAEQERLGGMGMHISPFMQGQELASLLSSCNFNLVTVDMDTLTVNYPSIFEVMEDLKGMGENNAVRTITPLNKDTLLAAASIYQSMYANEDGSVPATFQVLYFIAWKPSPDQAKPIARGSTPKGFAIKSNNMS